MEELWKGLVEKGLYTKSFSEFQEQYNNQEGVKKLHTGLVNKNLYTKSEEDFANQYGFVSTPNVIAASQSASESSMGSTDEDELPEDKGWFEDMFTAISGGAKAGSGVGEAFDVYRQGRNISEEDLKGYVKAANAMSENPETNEAASWRKDTEKYGGGFLGGFMGLLENPGYAPQFIASSFATMVSSLVDSEEVAAATTVGAGVGYGAGSGIGALGGSIGGPIGTALGYVGGGAAGAIGGGMAGLVGAMETGLTLTDLLRDELGDKDFNEKNIRVLLNDKDVMDRVKSRSLARGLTIGAVEGLTFGLSRGVGGKVLAGGVTGLSKAGLKTGAKVAAATTGIEMVGGGGGEALGMLAAGQELKGEEIFLEAIGEAKGAVNTSDIVKSALTNTSYKLNGEDVTTDKIKEIIDNPNTSKADLAKMNIEVTGDKAFDNFVKSKQNEAIVYSQIDESITDEKDRNELVELAFKRDNAIANTKKEGVNQVPGAKQALEDIESSISDIINKYEGAVDVAATQEAADVRKARRDISLAETISFLETNKNYTGKEVVIADNDASAQVAHDKAVEEYNAKQTDPEKMLGDENVSGADGFIVGDVIVINKDVAGRTGQINVGAHELLHGIVAKHMKSLSVEEQNNLMGSFVDVLTKDQKKYVETEFNRRKDTGETLDPSEWLTIFSDGITKGKIKFDEGVFDKLKNIIQEILRKIGYSKEFKNGRQVYNFMKDYQKSVAAGGQVSARAIALAGGGVTAGETSFSRSGPIDTVNAIEDVIRKKVIDRGGVYNKSEFQQSRGFADIYNSVSSNGGAINNYIKSLGMSPGKTQETIDSVTDRLLNYDPEATRKKGDSSVTIGEFLMANIGFAKLDAAKKLFVEGEKAKRETSIDTEEAKQIADETETTELVDRTKARNLRDFDIELKDGLVDEAIVEQVEALLNKNPENLEEQIEKLILNDIRKKLASVIPKIGKDKKTGKVGPTAEYEKFIRSEYAEIVQSLGMEVIRTAYRPWFEKNKIRTEKYKGISPNTGKVTNYVKDVFENKTNKREYLKWFLENSPNNLRERRTALIRRIARRKTKIAVDNYIEANSKDLEKVAEAKLRKLSTAIEDTVVEKKSFDSVKFSVSLEQEFSLIYRKTKKVGTKYIGYTNPYTNEPQEFVDLGRMWEQAFANYFMKMKIEGLDVVSKVASEIGGMADFVFKYNDKTENHELKASVTAFMGSVSISNYNLKKGKVTLATDTHTYILKDVDMTLFKKGYKARINYLNEGIKRLNKTRPPNKQYTLLKYDVTSGKPQYAPNELFNEKDFGTKMFYQLKSDESVIQNHYKGKEVYSLSFVGKNGAMSVSLDDRSILNLPMLSADTDINFTFRNPGSKIINGDKMRAVSLGIQFKISNLKNNLNDTPDITRREDIENALGINFSKSIEGKKINNAVKASRSTGNENIVKVGKWNLDISTKQGKKIAAELANIKTVSSSEFKRVGRWSLDTSTKEGKRILAQLEEIPTVSSSETKGITVLDFDDTLATTKSEVIVIDTNIKQEKLFNGSPKSFKQLGDRAGLIFLASEVREAEAYAESNRGEVKEIYVDKSKIGTEAQLLSKIEELGYSTEDALAYELIDTRFPNSLKQSEINEVIKALKKDGLSGVEYTDGAQVVGKNTKSTVVFDKSAVSETPIGSRKINAEEFAKQGGDLLAQGFEFDFSEFNKVVEGKTAPLFNKAMKLAGKFGTDNMFVLTARSPESAKAIKQFLDAQGLDIPLKNITGLGKSEAEAKALWIAEKVGEGYNDFYFADDAIQNVKAVKNMLDQFDVKSKVQQARVKFSQSMDSEFNKILEDILGIEAVKRFSSMKARKRGESKGKFRFFIPPSHEDFVGLLYNFMGVGKKGNAHRDFLEQALVRPLNRANKELDTARQSIANDFKSLNKRFPDVKSKLKKKTPEGDFTNEDAIRVYLWDTNGYDIPGITKTDQKNLVDYINSNPELKAYADTLSVISKQEAYVNPTEGWESGDIRVDLNDATGRVGREEYFAEFLQNTDIIFSEENLNKIEAGYGKGVREALEDMLYRIKTGRNRPSGSNALVNRFVNYINGAVGSVMFFNIRSSVLQQMSIVNYINFADNNMFNAAKAFADQKQYWSDWSYIFNSDMLKQRRGGIQTDVNGSELAETISKSKFPMRTLIRELLKIGFTPTQIGDNIAIATGGATYYRNRIKTYLKQGLSKTEAEAKAWTDFQDITQSTQQSARPDMVSQQQASPLGKFILAFQNVTSQFNRLGKKAFLDIKNRRITKPNTSQFQSDVSNASRIMYYFAVQNMIFYGLQTALFAALFDDNEDDEKFLKKKERMINGSIDSVLRGSGVMGAVVATMKNMAMKFAEQREAGYNKDESAVLMEMLNVSPPLGIKARKIVNAEKTLNYNKKAIEEMETFDIDNPQWSAATSYIEGVTNVPVNRLYNKTQNMREALNNQHSAWQRALMFMGWSKYNLGASRRRERALLRLTQKAR